MRRAQLLLSLALVHGQYHMPRAKFDDVTGAPLNDAARSILQRHSATAPAPGAGAAEAFDSLADVVVAAGTWKFVLLECDVDGRILDPEANAIPGLYGAGRATAGLSAGGYASGLSLGDGTFFGRRTGRAAASD